MRQRKSTESGIPKENALCAPVSKMQSCNGVFEIKERPRVLQEKRVKKPEYEKDCLCGQFDHQEHGQESSWEE